LNATAMITRDKLAEDHLHQKCQIQIIKTRTGCQYVGYFYYSVNLIGLHKTLNWAACGPRVGQSCSRRILNNVSAALLKLGAG